jgi:hypothetical protein
VAIIEAINLGMVLATNQFINTSTSESSTASSLLTVPTTDTATAQSSAVLSATIEPTTDTSG